MPVELEFRDFCVCFFEDGDGLNGMLVNVTEMVLRRKSAGGRVKRRSAHKCETIIDGS